jgi:hypothetical protein
MIGEVQVTSTSLGRSQGCAARLRALFVHRHSLVTRLLHAARLRLVGGLWAKWRHRQAPSARRRRKRRGHSAQCKNTLQVSTGRWAGALRYAASSRPGG